MKISLPSRLRRFLLATAFLAGMVWNIQASAQQYAYLIDLNTRTATDLGTLGGMDSSAGAVNDEGQVAGWAEMADGNRHAFITGPDGAGMADLNSLLDLPHGVILTEATDINNAGQVIAIGTIPEPESYALLLAGLALIGAVLRRKNQGAALLSP